MSTKEIQRAEHEYRQATVQREYHLKQVRYHLYQLALSTTKVSDTQQIYYDLLSALDEPDPDEERSRIIRLLTIESARDGRVYGEEDVAMLTERANRRKAEAFHRDMLQKYREKRAQK